MRQVTVHAAKTNLSKLIEAALSGEDIVIARGDQPAVRLVPVRQQQFRLGLLKASFKEPLPDFTEPTQEDDLKLWEGGA